MTSIYGNGGGSFNELPSPKKTNVKRKQVIADTALLLVIIALVIAALGAPLWVCCVTAGAIIVAGVVRFYLP